MTFNECLRLLQQKYEISEHDALEIMGVKRYKQEIRKRGSQHDNSKSVDR